MALAQFRQAINRNGRSDPPYPLTHSGACIVAGNAWCLHEDLQQAGALPVIAVNGAAREVKAFALYSQHPDRFARWIRWQKRLHPNFTVHSSSANQFVDHVWDIENGGGSAWGARKVAFLMGFTQVILCGCPMQVGPYVGNHNLGGFMHKEAVVDELFERIKTDEQWHGGCISMSGRTKDLLC